MGAPDAPAAAAAAVRALDRRGLAGLAGIGDLVDAMVTVGSENPYWRYDDPRRRVSQSTLVALTWPVTAVFGYSPWSRFSRAQDVPTGAARQMAASILRPGGILADPAVPADRYAAFTAPVLACSIADDEFATAPSVDDLAAAYPDGTRRHIHPAQAGLDTVGHFGYFRPRSRALWDDPVTWLDQQVSRDRSWPQGDSMSGTVHTGGDSRCTAHGHGDGGAARVLRWEARRGGRCDPV